MQLLRPTKSSLLTVFDVVMYLYEKLNSALMQNNVENRRSMQLIFFVFTIAKILLFLNSGLSKYNYGPKCNKNKMAIAPRNL